MLNIKITSTKTFQLKRKFVGIIKIRIKEFLRNTLANWSKAPHRSIKDLKVQKICNLVNPKAIYLANLNKNNKNNNKNNNNNNYYVHLDYKHPNHKKDRLIRILIYIKVKIQIIN